MTTRRSASLFLFLFSSFFTPPITTLLNVHTELLESTNSSKFFFFSLTLVETPTEKLTRQEKRALKPGTTQKKKCQMITLSNKIVPGSCHTMQNTRAKRQNWQDQQNSNNAICEQKQMMLFVLCKDLWTSLVHFLPIVHVFLLVIIQISLLYCSLLNARKSLQRAKVNQRL